MVPNHATYRATSGRHARLRFSKSGAKPIEDAYSRHYKWNQSAENKQKAIKDAEPEATAVDAGLAVQLSESTNHLSAHYKPPAPEAV